MKHTVRLLLFSALILSICGLVCAQDAPKISPITNYYFGEVKMSSPTGQPYGSSLSLVKRTLTPADNQIVEIVMSIDPKQPNKEYTTVFAVKASAFTVKEIEGTFDGAGKLSGPAWNWTGWTYTVNMLGERKGTLQAEDFIVNGQIVVRKSFYSPDKQLRVVFEENLGPITKNAYEILHAKLMVK